MPKKIAKPSPNLNMLEKAIQNLRLSYILEADAAHPRCSWKKTGFAVVKKIKSKNKIIFEVAKEILKPN